MTSAPEALPCHRRHRCRSGTPVPAPELQPLSAGRAPGQGLPRLRRERRALSRFHRGHRRQRAGPRPSPHRQGHPRAGRAADPLLESLLPRIPGTARQEAGRNQRPPAHLLHQQRHRGHGRRDEDDPVARQQERDRQARNHLAGEFLSRPHAGRALDYRPGQVPPGFRAAAAWRAIRARQRSGGAGSGL